MSNQPEKHCCAHFLMQSLSALQAAKMFVSGKKSMAASGNLANTPFVDEL